MEKKRNIYKIICIVLAIILLIVLGVFLRNWVVERNAQEAFRNLTKYVNEEEWNELHQQQEADQEGNGEEEAIPQESWQQLGIDIPQRYPDWDALWNESRDIYAWIYIPNTNVDYPILQHPTDDSYYLNHNLNGSRGYPGCIYTELINNKNFLDYNTLIYGHNMKNQTMFRTLHNYEDINFFNENPYIYIYTPDEILVYEIFAAYETDDAHILYNNDFSTESGYQSYLDKILGTRDMSVHIRSDVQVTSQSHIITLSTCVSGKSSRRYLVQAVLLNDSTIVTE